VILHLIRHPRPLVAPGICYGRLDLPADDPPAVAAALRGELPPGLPVWSSPLQRCRVLAGLLHAAPAIDARLMEMDFGDWEGRPWDSIPRAELDAWAADIADYAPPGGESPRQLQQRVLAFVATLAVAEAVLVTHAGVIRSLHAYVSGRPIADCLDVRPAYGSRTRLVLAPA
jgi:alpha-ribazole phosphatase